ncbi:hypothetical protein PN36_15975 [Candidatus Thiomargarita nelsonii]|uniref:TPR repeat-containing protein n=1 Tax=Candidatus Thiomargarita nelsonii TaxID=1003181 RepID=A0A0A6PJE5_9GAMM|nr:hypothetical protein PN36_15975 [Candidatus Thiomargarita nelsonii]
MKIKLLLKNVVIMSIPNLLMGCASQLTPSEVLAFETPPSKIEIQGNPHAIGLFISRQQEQMYKILVAEIAKRRGNNTLAALYFFEVAAETGEPRFAEQATKAALYAQQYDIAAEAASLWIRLAPNNPYARQLLGGILLRQNRPDQAVIHLEAMLDTFKDEPEQVSALISTLLEAQSDQTLALELMEKLLAKRPNNPVVLLSYSRFLIGIDQLDKASVLLQRLLKQSPDHAEAVPLYAHLLDKQGKRSLALKWLKSALDKFPKQQEWRLMYARMLVDADQFKESIKQFKLLSQDSQQKGDILYALGVLSLQVKDNLAAKKYFLALLDTGHKLNTARYYLGQIAQDAKDLQKAIYWYKQIDGGSNYLNAHARIALIFSEQGELDKAIEHLRSLHVERQEDIINLMLLEAELLSDQKQYRQVMKIYDRVLSSAPDNIEVLYQRAMLHEKMGRIDLLERDLRRLLEIDPENADALNALGYSLTVHTDRYQDAYKFIKQALLLSPTDYYILDSMGWVLYKMGKYAEAIAYLRKAQSKREDPEMAAHLGEVLWMSGDQQAAKEVWEKAQKTFPNDEKLREVIRHFLYSKKNGES